MKNEQESFVVQTPRRKRLGGLWLILMAVPCVAMWNSDVKSADSSNILLFVAGILVLLGIYKIMSYTRTVFLAGEPRAEQSQYHFGFFKKVLAVKFDKLDLLRRDKLLPYCQVYAYTSMERLAESLSPAEMEVYQKNQHDLPGIVVVDHTTKKDCLKLIEDIWRFYGLWEEPLEEEVPTPGVEDDEDEDYDEDEG